MGKAIAVTIVTGIIGILIAMVGKHFFGVDTPVVNINPTINVGLPKADPAQEEARRAAEARRKHEEALAAIRRQEEQARANAEALRRQHEAARAAAELDEANRRRREAAEAERIARAQRIQEWRRANGGCDPPLRRQCMYANGQQMGCICVR
jgi:hypothetical protein